MLAQRLYDLDRTSTRFPEQLSKLLRDREWTGHIQRLPEVELVELLGYIDEVRLISRRTRSYSSPSQILDGLDRMGSPFRDCLHVLREICCSRTVLPPSYEVFSALSFVTAHPVASGSWSDVYRGTLGTADVCIKRLLVTLDSWARCKQVSYLHSLRLDGRPERFWRTFVGRQWCGNTSVIRTLCPSRV